MTFASAFSTDCHFETGNKVNVVPFLCDSEMITFHFNSLTVLHHIHCVCILL